jgi:hypothetical protein
MHIPVGEVGLAGPAELLAPFWAQRHAFSGLSIDDPDSADHVTLPIMNRVHPVSIAPTPAANSFTSRFIPAPPRPTPAP